MKQVLSIRAALALAFVVICVILGFTPANAADAAAASTDVVVPWGAWLSSALASIVSIAITFLSYAVAKWAPAYVKVFVTDDLISKAVNYGFGAVEGAVAGKSLDIKTANAVIASAANYAVQSEPLIAKWLGANLMPTILAKLSALGVLPADASAANTGAGVTGAAK
ncbi:hypothetical protein CCR94_16190 [Rhodoblastus sphagnicola]|uniref:Uncharacterized protein n=1 Tax=Rhodoblastus sphagnicola TaxID=333368 RepID=A0A2S6N2V0_9HYPH|nr:hypothetical protein [Rhodoblastus sphagnicola]MBB4199031.1 hypothetical protein [Rhodoblastus sphagnicola]PPQ28929.1 hypothetical protein CCR94_16190 [Rhodoblastus sphagnicola]